MGGGELRPLGLRLRFEFKSRWAISDRADHRTVDVTRAPVNLY